MEIKNLNNREIIYQNIKVFGAYNQLENLLTELRKRTLPDEIVANINSAIKLVNSAKDVEFRNQIKKAQADILTLLEKELKMVPKNHYRNYWMAMGLAVFGVPIGVLYGLLNHNMAMLSFGLPIGLLVGMAVGASMDKKALKEGRLINIEIK
jgi:hypothetical protein